MFYSGTPKHRNKWCEQCRSKTKCTGTQWHLTDHQEQGIRHPLPITSKRGRLKPKPTKSPDKSFIGTEEEVKKYHTQTQSDSPTKPSNELSLNTDDKPQEARFSCMRDFLFRPKIKVYLAQLKPWHEFLS